MPRVWPSLALLVFVASLGRAGPASATVMLEASVDQLTRQSDAVVRGTVISTEGRPSADGQRLFTRVTLAVAEAWKGAPGETVVVQVPGGIHGDIGQVVHGAPTFAPGEEVVVFLRRQPPGPTAAEPTYRVSGMAQGKLRVERDAARGPVAVPDLRGVTLKRRSDDSGVPVPVPPPAPVPVAELRARVEAASR